MDCSLGRHRNPFCYIFSLACSLLPVCMWWRDVISTHSVETSDNSHYTVPAWAAFTARTGTPGIWKHPTRGLTQKNISPGAAGVGERVGAAAAGWRWPRSCADATKHVGPKVFPAATRSEKFREGSGATRTASEGWDGLAWKARFLLSFRPQR